jgi:hypothetical protein
MATVAKLELITDNRRPIQEGSETSLDALFTTQARQVGIKPSMNIEAGMDLIIKVDKLEPLQCRAVNPLKMAESKMVGGNSLITLLQGEDLRKKLKVLGQINPEEKLGVSIETSPAWVGKQD